MPTILAIAIVNNVPNPTASRATLFGLIISLLAWFNVWLFKGMFDLKIVSMLSLDSSGVAQNSSVGLMKDFSKNSEHHSYNSVELTKLKYGSLKTVQGASYWMLIMTLVMPVISGSLDRRHIIGLT